MRYLVLLPLIGAVAVACAGVQKDPRTVADELLAAHIVACESKAALIVASMPCEQAIPALETLVANDADCQAYFSKVPVHVDIAKACAPLPLDGGT